MCHQRGLTCDVQHRAFAPLPNLAFNVGVRPHHTPTLPTASTQDAFKMSYIIAFVKYSNLSKEYPVECFRTDIKADNRVIVELSDGRRVGATVVSVAYLNWTGKSKIICKAEEGAVSDGVFAITPETPSKVGLVSGDCLISTLRDRGWTPLRYKNTYRMVLAYNNETQTGRIWVRKNGVDLQLLPEIQPLPKPFSNLSNARTDGRVVLHYLSQTTFNLYEGIVRFAQAFERNQGAYDRFFTAVGQRDRRTEALKEASKQRRDLARSGDEDFDVAGYIASNGGGDRAYVGDGMWITSSGRFVDDGR
jgi:hypothetical protein